MKGALEFHRGYWCFFLNIRKHWKSTVDMFLSLFFITKIKWYFLQQAFEKDPQCIMRRFDCREGYKLEYPNWYNIRSNWHLV